MTPTQDSNLTNKSILTFPISIFWLSLGFAQRYTTFQHKTGTISQYSKTSIIRNFMSILRQFDN